MPGNVDSDMSPEEWASGVEQSGQSDRSSHFTTTTGIGMATEGGQGRTLKALRAENVTVWVPQNRLRVMKAKGGSVESYFRPQKMQEGGGGGGGVPGHLGPGLHREGSQDTPMYARISRRHSPLRSLSYSAETTEFNGPQMNKNTTPTPVQRRHLERQKTITESAESINHIKAPDSSSTEYTAVKTPAGPQEQAGWAADQSTDSCCQEPLNHNNTTTRHHQLHHQHSSPSASPYGTNSSGQRLLGCTETMQNHQSQPSEQQQQQQQPQQHQQHLLPPPRICRSDRQRSTSAGNVYETVRDTVTPGDSHHESGSKIGSNHNLLPDTYSSRRARSVSPRAIGTRRETTTTGYRERLKDSSSQVDIQHFHRNITMSCDHEARDEDSEMSIPARVVLLACGSFNPVTNMHLRMFELARDALHQTGLYRVVGGIISPVSDGYDKKGLLAASHRCAMLRLALKSSDWIRMDTWECERDTWSPTVEVLRHHQAMLQSSYNANLVDGPTKRRKIDSNLSVDSDYSSSSHQNNGYMNEMSPVTIKLLCGADLLESFAMPDLWKPEDMEEIVKVYGIACISRSGTNPEKFIYESDLLSKFKNNIHLVTEWMHNDMSSTKIRRALMRGESVKYLVQDSVIDYVLKNRLYGAGENKLMNYTTPSPNRDSPELQIYLQMSPKSSHLASYSSAGTFRQNSYERKNSNERHNQSACNDLHYSIDRELEAINQNGLEDSAYNHNPSLVDTRHSHGGFRRHKDINYDQEQRRGVPRRSESLDRRQLTRNSTFDKNSEFNKRVSSSFDSLDSPPRSPRSSVTQCGVSSSHSDMSGLVRRVQGLRIASLTPETSV